VFADEMRLSERLRSRLAQQSEGHVMGQDR